MGRNGCGKSTLSKIIAGHPSYNITSGDIKFSGENINSLEPEERSQSGIFLGFQYPIEIPGVSNLEFLRVSTNARRLRNFLLALVETLRNSRLLTPGISIGY